MATSLCSRGRRRLGSAFFKPIVGLSATDELKLGATESVKLIKPTPTIRVNDAELRSPGSPRVVTLGGVGTTGFAEPTPSDTSEEVRAILERCQPKGSLEARPHSTPGRESPSTRKDSINQLQRLQQHSKVPQLGGKVSRLGCCVASPSLLTLSLSLSLSLSRARACTLSLSKW